MVGKAKSGEPVGLGRGTVVDHRDTTVEKLSTLFLRSELCDVQFQVGNKVKKYF